MKVQTPQTNPSTNKTNPQTQTNLYSNNEVLEKIIQGVVNKYSNVNKSNQNVNKSNALQQTQSEFFVKSSMKASYISLKISRLLLINKEVTLSALGHAVPILLDSVFLVKKDLTRMAINVNIVIELFEREVFSQSSQKKVVISGLKITLSI